MENGAPQRQSLLPAYRKQARHRFASAFQTSHAENIRLPFGSLRLRNVIDSAEEVDVFRNAEVVIERKLLGHVADGLLDLLRLSGEVKTSDAGAARRGR